MHLHYYAYSPKMDFAICCHGNKAWEIKFKETTKWQKKNWAGRAKLVKWIKEKEIILGMQE